MSDEEQVVQEEVKPEEQKPEAVEQPQEQVVEASEAQEEQPKRKDAEYNFKKLREEREADRRRAEEAQREVRELREFVNGLTAAQRTTSKDTEDDELDKLSQDDLLTVKHHDKKVDRKLKPVEKELQAVKSELAEMRFRAKYPDIDEVLSSENIELFKKQKPELASIIARMDDKDPQKAIAAYEVIKTIVPAKQPEPFEKKRATENIKKPASINSLAGGSAISNAFMWDKSAPSKDLKAKINKETEEAIKRG